MTISILMPARNAASWLPETLESIRLQTYADWELLAVDDHSSDHTLDLLEAAAASDSRIRVFSHTERGIIPALQRAYAQSTGTFITRMDADDIMPPDRLRKMVARLTELGPGNLVTGQVRYFPTPVTEGYLKYEHWINTRTLKQDHYDHIYRECVVASPNWMVHASDLEQCEGISALEYPEDYDFIFRWYAAGFAIVSIPDTTLLWREHPLRTSRNSEIYDQASFFRLKLSWFLRLNAPGKYSLALFGAGEKGKLVAEFLDRHNLPFSWYDVNYPRYNTGIKGHPILSPVEAKENLALICVYPDDLGRVEDFFREKGYVIGQNAWYF